MLGTCVLINLLLSYNAHLQDFQDVNSNVFTFCASSGINFFTIFTVRSKIWQKGQTCAKNALKISDQLNLNN